MDTTVIIWQYVVPIAGAFFLAWIVHRLGRRFTERVMGLNGYVPQGMRVRQERRNTLIDLLGSAISFLAFLVATLFTLGLFIDTTTLVWTIGLFSAAFGLGARPIISDYLTGVTFIFGDFFDVGDKVEIMGVEGYIERISLSSVAIRSAQGELFFVPNGEVRVIRNFSRGTLSPADVTIKFDSKDLDAVREILEQLKRDVEKDFPDIVRPLQVVSENGYMGKQVELTILTKVSFGKASEIKLELLSEIQKRMTEAEIELAS